MITSFFINTGAFFLQGLLAILPTTEFPAVLENALNNVMYALNSFSYILPVDAIIGAVGIVLAYEFAVWGFKGVMWVWHKVPFLGK